MYVSPFYDLHNTIPFMGLQATDPTKRSGNVNKVALLDERVKPWFEKSC